MADDFVFISDEARKQIQDQQKPINHALVDLLRNTNAATKNPRSPQEPLQKAVFDALSTLKNLLSILKKLTPFETALSILDTVSAAIDAQKPEEAVLVSPNIAAASYNSVASIKSLADGLMSFIQHESNAVIALTIQLLYCLSSFAIEDVNDKYFSNILQTTSTMKALYEAVTKLSTSVTTYRFLTTSAHVTVPVKERADSTSSEGLSQNVWFANPNDIILKEDGSLHAGSLNHVFQDLASPDQYDNAFLKAFIVTYKSFTTPEEVLSKLIERFSLPKGVKQTLGTTDDQLKRIQLRLGVVLQQWIRSQFTDFTDELMAQLEQFLSVTMKPVQPKMEETLQSEIRKKKEERDVAIQRILKDPPPTLPVPEAKLSPTSLFLTFNDLDIAKQLTMIEFGIFSKIRSSELLDQSWNVPKNKHKSLNVIELIGRANKVSYWIASTILYQNSLETRIKIVTKFVNIAKHLRDMQNFATCMGFIAGLNMSSVSRLAQTFEGFDQTLRDSLQELTTLLDPSSSFKNYREALRASVGPCLPYLGAALTDLTFAEDGNPDTVPSSKDPAVQLINFSKRELICQIINTLQLYQSTPYTFPVVEPVHTFLRELPSLDEKSLYALSLRLETRRAPKPVENMPDPKGTTRKGSSSTSTKTPTKK